MLGVGEISMKPSLLKSAVASAAGQCILAPSPRVPNGSLDSGMSLMWGSMQNSAPPGSQPASVSPIYIAQTLPRCEGF